MNNPIAGPIESRKAWEDTESWSLITLESRNGEQLATRLDEKTVQLAMAGPYPRPLPRRVAYSPSRSLLAAATTDGPIVPIDHEHGVFALLGGGERFVFLRVSPVDPTESTACVRCSYPSGYSGEELCPGHRSEGLGRVYRSSAFVRLQRNADAAAFNRDLDALGRALDELVAVAYPLQASRLFDKYVPLLEPGDLSVRLAHSLSSMAAKAGDLTAAEEMRTRAGAGEPAMFLV